MNRKLSFFWSTVKPFTIHAFAQVLALFGSVIRIPLILVGISELDFAAVLICLQFLGLSGLIFGGSRLLARNPPERFLSDVSTVEVHHLTKEILSWSGWLFCLGCLNAQLFLLVFSPANDSGGILSITVTVLSSLLFGLSSYLGTLTGILDRQNEYNGVALSDVFSTILMIPLTYLAMILNAGAWAYLAIGSLTLFNSGAYAMIKLRKEGIFHRISFKTSSSYTKSIAGRMGQGLGAFLSNNFDLLIIGRLGNQLDAIDYSATSRINLAVDLPSAANAPRQWFEISKLEEKEKDFTPRINKINARFAFSNLMFILPIAVILNIFYPRYMHILLGDDYDVDFLLLWAILLSRIFYTTYSTLYLSLSLASRVKIFTRLGIYIGFLNVISSCLFMKSFPLIGPALGTALASTVGIGVIVLKNSREPKTKASL